VGVSGIVPALAAAAIGIHLARRHQLRFQVRLDGHTPRLSIVRMLPLEQPAI
jgi:hypothetical protein